MPIKREVGDRDKSTTTFNEENGTTPFDPPVILFKLTHVDTGTVTEYRYGVDSEIVKVSTGFYSVEFAYTAAGKWAIRWQGLADEADASSAMGADEDVVFVSASKFSSPILPES